MNRSVSKSKSKRIAESALKTTSTSLVILGGTLINSNGEPPIEDAMIVIKGNRIRERHSPRRHFFSKEQQNHRRERQDHSPGLHGWPRPL